jgi:bifunctional DNase/RNase
MMVNMEVVGVRIEMPSNQPIVLLKEVEGSRFLPIWVGAVEATAIAFAQQGMVAQRPLTHDLISNILEAADLTLTAVQIVQLKDGIFYAELQVRTDSGTVLKISARPSDAIAIALRTKSNILADSDLLDEVGIDIPERLLGEGEVGLGTGGEGGSDVELERWAVRGGVECKGKLDWLTRGTVIDLKTVSDIHRIQSIKYENAYHAQLAHYAAFEDHDKTAIIWIESVAPYRVVVEHLGDDDRGFGKQAMTIALDKYRKYKDANQR